MSDGQLLLDTNCIIHFFNGNSSSRELLNRADKLFLCPPVLSELLYGALESRQSLRNLERIQSFSSRCQFLPIDELTAKRFAETRKLLRHVGRPIPVNDQWIAAIALQHSLALASVDSHFSVVPDLRVIGW